VKTIRFIRDIPYNFRKNRRIATLLLLIFLFVVGLILIAYKFDGINKNTDEQDEINGLIIKSEETLFTDIERSLLYARQSLQVSQRINDEKLLARSFNTLGNSLYFANSIDSSLFYNRCALAIFQRNNEKEYIAKVYNSIGNCFRSKMQNDSALFYYNAAYNLSVEMGDIETEGNSQLNKGALYSNNFFDYEKAEELTLNALQLLRETGNDQLITQAIYNMAVIRRNVGDYEKAEALFFEALGYYSQKGYIYKEMNVYLNLGSIFYSTGDYKKSRHYFLKLLELSKKHNYKNGLASAYHNLASIQKKENHYEEAIALYNKAVPVNQESGNLIWLSNNYSMLGLCYKELADYQRAVQYTKKGLAIDIELADSSALTESYCNLADIFLAQAQPDSAVLYLTLCRQIAEKTDDPSDYMDMYEKYAVYYQLTNQYDSAFLCLSKYNSYKDEVNITEQQTIVEDLEIKHGVQLKDAEIVLLSKHIQRKNEINLFLIAIVLLLTSSIVFSYKFYFVKNKRKAEKLEFEKQLLEQNKLLSEALLVKAENEIHNQARLIIEKNRLISQIREELTSIKQSMPGNDIQIEKVAELLTARIITEDNWSDFKQKFALLHPGFIPKMNITFGKLSDAELRLACLIKLKISNKDIASMLGISHESVIKSKYRFRKKIELDEHEQLDDLISGM